MKLPLLSFLLAILHLFYSEETIPAFFNNDSGSATRFHYLAPDHNVPPPPCQWLAYIEVFDEDEDLKKDPDHKNNRSHSLLSNQPAQQISPPTDPSIFGQDPHIARESLSRFIFHRNLRL